MGEPGSDCTDGRGDGLASVQYWLNYSDYERNDCTSLCFENSDSEDDENIGGNGMADLQVQFLRALRNLMQGGVGHAN